MTGQPYPAEWLRGVLDLTVLRILDDGPTYGYAIAARLDDEGFGTIKGGTLYPLLGRAEEAGDVVTHWEAGESGPGRKYYTLTPSGRERLGTTSARWSEFADRTTRFLSPAPNRADAPTPARSTR